MGYFRGAAAAADWSLTGNASATAGTNFIGTTDAVDFVVKTGNSERMRVLASGNTSVGTATGEHKFNVSGGNVMVVNYGVQPNIIQRRANGTEGSPSLINAADQIVGSNNFQAFLSAGNYVNVARLVALTDEAHTASALGSRLAFYTTANGTTSAAAERMRITNAGLVGIGSLAPANLLSVGANNEFQVNASGDLVKIDNVSYNWPASQGSASTVLTNDGSGSLSWAAATALPTVVYGESLAEQTQTGTSWVTKHTLAVPAGTWLITVSGEATNGTYSYGRVNVIDNAGNTFIQAIYTGATANAYAGYSATAKVTYSSGATISVQIVSSNATNLAKLRNSRITAVRVAP